MKNPEITSKRRENTLVLIASVAFTASAMTASVVADEHFFPPYHGEKPTKAEQNDSRYEACWDKERKIFDEDNSNSTDWPLPGGGNYYDDTVAQEKAANYCVKLLFDAPSATP